MSAMKPGEVPAGAWQQAVDVWNETRDMARVLAAVIPPIAEMEREECARFVETHVYFTHNGVPGVRPEKHAGHDQHHATLAAAIRARGGAP